VECLKDEKMMKHIARSLSLASVLTIWSAGALSQQMQSEWYGEVGAGVAFQSETDLDQLGIPFSADYDTGFIVSAAVGRQFPESRLEAELFYSENDFDSISILGLSAALDGDVSVFGGLLNIFYDFDTGTQWQPFIGAGAGYARVSIDDASTLGIPFSDDDDSVFAYQFKFGLAYQYNSTTSLLINYRFLGTEDLEFTDAFGVTFSADGVENHSVQVGVRFRF
jgi:opacity protein-like surface antigen